MAEVEERLKEVEGPELLAEALKVPRPKTREMRGQRWGTLATMTAVEVSPAYQFR